MYVGYVSHRLNTINYISSDIVEGLVMSTKRVINGATLGTSSLTIMTILLEKEAYIHMSRLSLGTVLLVNIYSPLLHDVFAHSRFRISPGTGYTRCTITITGTGSSSFASFSSTP
jgi:hypothetical protein